MLRLKPIVTAAVFSTSISSAVYADRVFPPAHLSVDAQFAETEVSDKPFERPWYEEGNLNQVEVLKAEEKIEPSPYVNQYYYVLARSYSNDLAGEVARLKRLNGKLAIRSQSETAPGS